MLQVQFSQPLLAWYDKHGRKNLPWQNPKEPYRVWVSEIMLQQTQVQTVVDYFNRFINRFPSIQSLAQASEDEVLSLWSGLGYYSRARNLHQTAKIVAEHFQGQFPEHLEALTQLPGIGPSTAAAILSQAFNQATAILDGNVKRVLTRFFMVEGWPEQSQVKKTLWALAKQCMPSSRCADYTQAIMDLGALCCTSKKPACTECPVQNHCLAYKNKQQQYYPSKRIKKTPPIQQKQFLVLVNEQGQIFLEKRPPTGIWGGLWCLPSLDKETCPIHFIEKHYSLSGKNPSPLIDFTHRFSHFHLEINAVQLNTEPLCDRVSEPTGHWFWQEQLKTLGLATPTRLILDRYFLGSQ